jgi:hypothetical protein
MHVVIQFNRPQSRCRRRTVSPHTAQGLALPDTDHSLAGPRGR